MARPKKGSKEKLTHQLPPVRCTEKENRDIRKKAEESGLSVSEFIRHYLHSNDNRTARRGNGSDTPSHLFSPELVYELHRIGNNLNQLTKKYHATNTPPPTVKLTKLLDDLEPYLNHIFKQIKLG